MSTALGYPPSGASIASARDTSFPNQFAQQRMDLASCLVLQDVF
jgi:hypothetical protein